jgi:hypothetical protein
VKFAYSFKLFITGTLKKVWFYLPPLVLDPFDIAERVFGINWIPPNWLAWTLFALGWVVAGAKTYHELRESKLKLEARLDDRKRNREIRESLGEYLERGRELMRLCTNEKSPPPDDEANQWADEVEQFLHSQLDSSYVSRFRSSAGLPLSANSIFSLEHRNLWAGIHVRVARLTEFITELSVPQSAFVK